MRTPAVLFCISIAAAGLSVHRTAPSHVSPTSAHSARVLVVAPNGDDQAPGTASAPLRTIQLAVDRLRSGGTVELRGGRYQQRFVLRRARNLVVRPFRAERPILDGAGLVAPRDISAMVTIAAARNVTVAGLDIRGYRTHRLGVVPVGIYVHRWDRGVDIVGNHVHDLGNLNPTLGSFDINAHGIAVYGDDPHRPISDLTIRDNRLDRLVLGASESLVVNGNVDGWSIAHNDIHDNNNIGIDAIGYEPTLPGRYRYTDLDRARNGVIADNRVSRIRSRGNPAYYEDGGWCNCADGIYVDGGTHIVVRNNMLRGDDIGIEVAAENGRGSADHVRVIGNNIAGSLFVGIATGGYCDGHPDCGGVRTGRSHDNLFTRNTLRNNNGLDDGSPELLVQYYSYRDTFTHNVITATDSDGVVYGSVPRAHADGHDTGDLSDFNVFRALHRSRRTAVFGWRGHTYVGFGSYRRHTHQDAHSVFVG